VSAERLADLYRSQRDAPRVHLGVLVALREPTRECLHLRAEERLLRSDELAGAEVAEEGPGLRLAAKVQRDGRADRGDPEYLEAVADP
jgi:hypothetical protein